MPDGPVALANSFTKRGRQILRRLRGQTLNAMTTIASPARIAIASPNTFVIGGHAAPQVIIIHGRQIVVNQAESVNQFDRTRGRQRRRGRGAAGTSPGGFSTSVGRSRFRRPSRL